MHSTMVTPKLPGRHRDRADHRVGIVDCLHRFLTDQMARGGTR